MKKLFILLISLFSTGAVFAGGIAGGGGTSGVANKLMILNIPKSNYLDIMEILKLDDSMILQINESTALNLRLSDTDEIIDSTDSIIVKPVE